MHIVLMILAKIGIGLLIILGIILVLLALLLFTPFVYKVNVCKLEKFEAFGGVGWLFNLLHATFGFSEGKLDWDLRIAGFSLKNKLTGGKKKKKKPKKEKKQKKQPTIMPGEKADKKVIKEAKAQAKAEIKIKEGKKKPPKDIYEEGESEGGLPERIKNRILSLIDMFKKIRAYTKAYEEVKPRIFKLIRHILPRKLEGWIRYGFDDPSMTGKTLAMICMFYPVIPEKMSIRPVFDQAVLEGEMTIKGRFFLFYLAWHGLKIYFNKQVKIAMGRA